MTVDRTATAADPAVLSVHFAAADAPRTSAAATSAPAPTGDAPTEQVQTIDMKHRTNSEILAELVRVTRAYPVEATPAEQEELRLLEEQRLRSRRDSQLSQQVRARVKREQELLEQARGDVASQPA